MKDNVQSANQTPLDGTVGGDLDPDYDYEAAGLDDGGLDDDDDDNTANEPDKPTRLERLQENERPVLVKECKEAIVELKECKADNKANNTKAAAVRENLLAKGISKDALTFAIKVSELKEHERPGFFLALGILLEAVGENIEDVQMDMFGAK